MQNLESSINIFLRLQALLCHLFHYSITPSCIIIINTVWVIMANNMPDSAISRNLAINKIDEGSMRKNTRYKFCQNIVKLSDDVIIKNIKMLILVALWEICHRTFYSWKSLC